MVIIKSSIQIFFFGEDGRFIIHDDTNGNNLFGNKFDGTTKRLPITINAVIPINTDNGFGHARIKIYMTSINGYFDGVGYFTFYIKYLQNLV